MEIKKEIISVVVVTFNSATTIVETLDSIINQDYGSNFINLIISDDASTDNTTEVIKKWLEKNQKRFNEVDLICNNYNQGVTKNCNTAWKKVKTQWIKSIGGDDLLRTGCITSYMTYVNKNQGCSAIFSRMQWFGSINKVVPENYDLPFFNMNAEQQYEYLRFKSFNLAPTSFLNADALKIIDYADERFRNIEDLPLWLRFTKNGYKLHFNSDITVDYRVGDSISKNTKRYINDVFLNDLINIDKMHKFNDLKGMYNKLLKLDMLTLLYGKQLIKYITRNKKGKTSNLLDVILFALRPVYIFVKMKKIIKNRH